MKEEMLDEVFVLAEDADVREDAVGKSTKITDEDVAREKSIIELRLKHEELQGKRQDRQQRKDFAYNIFHFICAYMSVVILFVFLSGVSGTFFYLTDAVLITMLTTTLANVFGLFVIVTKYLFHTKE